MDNPSSSQQAKSVIIPPQNKTQTPKHLQPKLKVLSKWYKSPSSKRTTQVLQSGQPKLNSTSYKCNNPTQKQTQRSKHIQTKLKPPIVDTSKLQALPKWYKSPSSKLQKYYKSSNSAQAPKIVQHQLQTPNSKTYNAKLQAPKVVKIIKLSSSSKLQKWYKPSS